MKRLITLYLISIVLFSSCNKDSIELPTTTPPTVGIFTSPAQPNADAEVSITFKATSTSALYGYTGKVYAHIGVIVDGVWKFVPAAWNENLAKCEMLPIDVNTWKITLSPTIRAWFGSGETPVSKIGIVIRSEDGTKKGIISDSFINVTDSKYNSFQPAAVINAAVPANMKEGINIVDNTTVTLVLADKAKDGTHKDFAHVMGDFNNWTLSNTENSQMFRDENAGCWWITLKNLDATKEYAFQYYVGMKTGEVIRLTDPYSKKILDPDNDKYIPSTTYNQSMIYPQNAIGLVSVFKIQSNNYNWTVPNFQLPTKENLVIYEMLLRDFTQEGNLTAAIAKLDYLAKLGVTAVELMPIQEFDGNDSWGYNPSHYFAPDKAYGTPEMYKQFIDECHKRGIAVILDMVFNQATGNCPFAKMYWDGTKPSTNNPWMNVSAPHPYSVFEDFNHSSTATRNYFKQVLQYWITEFKVDGYRMDLTKGFTQKPSNEATASNYDQSRIDILTDYYNAAKQAKSDVLFILEHFCNYDEESTLANAGMYLWRNMNNAYSQAAMGYYANSNFGGMITLPRNWVGFAESHDEERNFYNAKTSGLGTIQSDSTVRLKRIPLNIAFSTLLPGPKMMWEFQELGFDYSINDFGGRTARKPAFWYALNSPLRKEAYDKSSIIISLRKKYPNAFINGSFTNQVDVVNWEYGRTITLTHADLNMVVIGNYKTTDITSTVNFSKTGTWYNIISGQELNVTSSSTQITLAANELAIFTDRKVN